MYNHSIYTRNDADSCVDYMGSESAQVSRPLFHYSVTLSTPQEADVLF